MLVRKHDLTDKSFIVFILSTVTLLQISHMVYLVAVTCVQITCYYNRVWLYIISTNTKMFKNPKWITFDILGLCNQLLTSHHNAQRAIQLFIDRRANTILIDRIRSLTGNIQPRVDDPRSNVRFNLKIIFISKIAYFSYDDHLVSAVDHGSRS